jgi:CcmD family protein
MEGSLAFLLAAFLVTFLGLALYLWSLQGRLDGLRREVEQLKEEERERRQSQTRSS